MVTVGLVHVCRILVLKVSRLTSKFRRRGAALVAPGYRYIYICSLEGGSVEQKKRRGNCSGVIRKEVVVEWSGRNWMADGWEVGKKGMAEPGERGQFVALLGQDLATKVLQIQSKRFYLDVKENRIGRFIKVAEIGPAGRKRRLLLPMPSALELRDHLTAFSEIYASLGPSDPDNLPKDGKLKSEMIVKENKRYYLDLKENTKGRFLRISQTVTRGGPRSQVAIPAQGMIEFRDALTDLLEEFGSDNNTLQEYKGNLPEARHMRIENKNFYFDVGQNCRGIYMRVSEVKSNYRTFITIPQKSWSHFRDIIAEYMDKLKEHPDKPPEEGK